MRLMVTESSGRNRYYIDGKRVSRNRYASVRADSYLDCFQIERTPSGWKWYAEARPRKDSPYKTVWTVERRI